MENKISKIICKNCNSETGFWGMKNNFNLYQCYTCSLIFVSPSPDPTSVYNQDYFSGAKGGFGYVDYNADKEPMVITFNKYIDLFVKYGKPNGRLFDIGAATGFFLKIAQKRGYEVSGVEMSNHAAGMARGAGLDVNSGDLMSLSLKEGSFDVVTMLDVLEHLTEPFSELLETKRILKTNGLLVVNAPNGQSLLAKILKTKWHLVLPPEHLFYFSPKNLGTFLEKNGFKVIYSSNIGKKFTFQYIFRTLYKWQKLSIWAQLSIFFSKGFLSKLYIPINLHDNFFLIAKKNEK
jgi:2-polyprenyl-3-methyl-5-hydroxy-6-metoxy-1,4-benzoquinol methylase